jgi:signal peptidase I
MARHYEYYKKKVNKRKIIKDIIYIYIIAVLLVLMFNSLFIQAFKIPSNSMEPTLYENNRILVNKFIYGPKIPFTDIRIFDGKRNIHRGDIIVFMSEEYSNKNVLFRVSSTFIYTLTFSIVDISNIVRHYDSNVYVKRIVGIPGDRIKFNVVNGTVVVYINGIPEKKAIELDYKTIEENEKNSKLLSLMTLQNEYVVKEGEYYVLGDNRISSSDSRIWGSYGVTPKQIIGKAIIKYWPTNQIGVFK